MFGRKRFKVVPDPFFPALWAVRDERTGALVRVDGQRSFVHMRDALRVARRLNRGELQEALVAS